MLFSYLLLLTPSPYREVALNGVVLSLNNDTSLPDLPPLHQSVTPTLHLPALSFGFYVFKDTKAKACMWPSAATLYFFFAMIEDKHFNCFVHILDILEIWEWLLF